jgi:hypothetical protein
VLIQLQGQVIGLDTAPLIYFIEQNEAYLELVRAFFPAMSQGEFQEEKGTGKDIKPISNPHHQTNQLLTQMVL